MIQTRHILPGVILASQLAGATTAPLVVGAVQSDVPKLQTARVTGTVLPIWNSPSLYQGLHRGLSEQGFRVLRFPNGSASNSYHWNGEGKFDSATGIWHPDSSKVGPGWLANTRYRGTTKNNYGSIFHSLIDDGADSTFWWSDPLGGSHPWVTMDFVADSAVDSVRIAWGDLRPDSVVVGTIATSNWNAYRGVDAHLEPLAQAKVDGKVTTLTFPSKSFRFLAIVPRGVGDQGVQIAEVTAWSKGQPVTKNLPSQADQTPVTAMGAHPGADRASDWSGTGVPPWDFATFWDYIQTIPGAQAQICVNYGTGTPEEAAAWVRYANVQKKLGIRYWQVGNELDGAWEEGGPVDARQYAAKFLAYAKAMKAVDPSILVLGPVMSTMDFANAASGQLDGTTWTEEVLRLVGEAEAKDNVRYLDGFDFHAYPYWTNGTPKASEGLSAMRDLGGNLDTLWAMMQRRLKDPGSRLVSMSEFNISVVPMDLMMRPENALGMASMLSQLVERFGGNAMSIVWESYEAGGTQSGGTYGALTLFSEPRSGSAASTRYVPNSPYWGNWMVSKAWAMDSAKPLTGSVTGKSQVDVHGLVRGSDTSWIFLNFSSSPCSLQVPMAGKSWLYQFSKAQYAWNGTTDQAFAFPNSGPVSSPLGASGKFELPAYGITVVRNTPAVEAYPAGEGHVVNLSVRKSQLELGDTLRLSGTILRDPKAPVPTARIGSLQIPLQAADGAFDGDQEAFLAIIPADSLGQGQMQLKVGESDSVAILVTGKLRPNVWVDRFNDQTPASEQPSKGLWAAWQAGADGEIKMRFPAREEGFYLRENVTLVQPEDLGYDVFGQVKLPVDRTIFEKSMGIKFEYAARHEAKGTFRLVVSTDTVTNYDDFTLSLPATDTAWKTVRIRWTDIKQQGWSGKSAGPLLPRQISALSFQIVGPGTATLWLDNIALLGTEGDSVSVGMRGRQAGVGFSARAQGDAWVVHIPAGSRLVLVGLDGRREEAFEAQAVERSVRWQPRRAGVVQAILESAHGREVYPLPLVH